VDEEEKVLIIGDWDADGVVSSAIVFYVQEKLGIYPVKDKKRVRIEPAGPRSIAELSKKLRRCWDCVVILDIPYTGSVETFLKEYRALGCTGRILYFDHHPSTIENAINIERRFATETFFGKNATSLILYRFLEGIGVRLPEKLKRYAMAVAVLEGRRHRSKRIFVDDRMVKLVASISKTLNKVRDPDLWKAYVKWLANPLPTEPPKVRIRNEVQSSLDVSKEVDAEAKGIAMELAMSSERLGYIRFVDARGRWRKRGATALASHIFRIVGEPVALLIDKDEGTHLLIIRSSKGLAMALAKKLESLGLLEDVGGHENIAVSRIVPNFDINKLKEALRRGALEEIMTGHY